MRATCQGHLIFLNLMILKISAQGFGKLSLERVCWFGVCITTLSLICIWKSRSGWYSPLLTPKSFSFSLLRTNNQSTQPIEGYFYIRMVTADIMLSGSGHSFADLRCRVTVPHTVGFTTQYETPTQALRQVTPKGFLLYVCTKPSAEKWRHCHLSLHQSTPHC
jgi:hypothetical protein